MKNYSKKVIHFASILFIGAALLISCKNGFFQSYEAGEIEFTLPYGKSQAQARDASGTSYNFEITFVHTSSNAKKVITGKSGDTITYKNAAPGKYQITAQAYDSAGLWEFDGTAEANVQKGRTTTVDLILRRVIRVWTKNPEMHSIVETFFNEHKESGYAFDFKSFNNEEEYYDELVKALTTNPPDAPDIYFVEPHRIYDFVKGDYKDKAMPYENLGINTEQALNDAQIVSYMRTLGSDYTDPNHPVLKALGYQSTISFYAYNKELARSIFGTDDPVEVETKLFRGGDSEADITWNNFVNKAQDIDADQEYDYVNVTTGPEYFAELLCGCGKTWYDPSNPSRLDISTREDTLNAIVALGDYTRQNDAWSEGWFNDMTNGEVLGFFGPSWLVSYTLTGGDSAWGICRGPVDYYWGGYFAMVNNNLAAKKKDIVKDFIYWYALDTSPNGLMYRFASRSFDGYTDAVASLKVQEEVNKTVPFLGDSRMFNIYKEAAQDFTININAGKYHNQICSIINDSIYDMEFETYGNKKMQVDIANSTDLDLDASSINNLPNYVTAQTAGANGIVFTSSNHNLYIKETSSEICAGFVDTPTDDYLYYPFTEAGKWYLFEVDGYFCAIKPEGGISCPVSWDEEYFGYENNWGESEYIYDAEITDSGNKTLSFLLDNKFSDYIHFSSNVTKKWLESYGEYRDGDDWKQLYYRNCKGNTDDTTSYITFPANSQSSTIIEISSIDEDPSSYFIYVAVDFQIEKYNNVYFKIPSIQSRDLPDPEQEP